MLAFPLLFIGLIFTGNLAFVPIVIIPLSLAFMVLSFVIARYFKQRMDVTGGTSSLARIPDIYMADLHLAGYPRGQILAAVWGASIAQDRLALLRILGMALLFLMMGISLLNRLSAWVPVITLWSVCYAFSFALVCNRYRVERALRAAVRVAMNGRRDLVRSEFKPDSTTKVTIALNVAMQLVGTFVLMRVLVGGAKPDLSALSIALHILISSFAGVCVSLLYGYAARKDFQLNYTRLDDFLKRLLENVTESHENASRNKGN